MVTAVEFRVDERQLATLKKLLNPKQLKAAIYNAVSRTTKRGERIAAKAVSDRLSIPKKYIVGGHRHAAIKSKVTKGENPHGTITVSDKRIPLIAFRTVDTKVAGVSVFIDNQKSPLTLKNAFVAKVASQSQIEQGVSHKGVFLRSKRAGKGDKLTAKGIAGRLHIDERFGPTVITFITRDEIRMAVEKQIGNELDKQLDSQVSRFTQGKFTTLADAMAVMDIGDTATDKEDNA